MRTTIFLTAATAAATTKAHTPISQFSLPSLPSVTPASVPFSSLSATDAFESYLQSVQSDATAAFGTGFGQGTGTKIHFPTNTESRASFLTDAASLQSEATAIVATLKHHRTFLSAFVSAAGEEISSLESSWSITPSLASATSAASSTGSSNGAAAPVMTAAPIMLGGVAAAAFALL